MCTRNQALIFPCHSALHNSKHIASLERGTGRELLQFSPTEIDSFLQKIIKDSVD